MLAVQRVHSSQPHQAHEQDDRPHDLHEETQLVEERFDYSHDLSLQVDFVLNRWVLGGIHLYVVTRFFCIFASDGTQQNMLFYGIRQTDLVSL